MYKNKTRELFVGLIERPPLTDQLLQRPPFRFLHDVVNATIQNTGYLMDKFTSEELIASNVTNKEAKASFLKKLIKALNDDGSLKDVKVTKIIAGKEPEMTNLVRSRIFYHLPRLLQKLAADAIEYRNAKLNDSEERKQKKGKKLHKKEINTKEGNNDKQRLKPSRSREIMQKEVENKVNMEKGSVNNEKRKGFIKAKHVEDAEVHASHVKIEQSIHTDKELSGTAKTEDSGIADDITNEKENNLVAVPMKEQPSLSLLLIRPRTSLERPGTASARPPPPKLKKKQVDEIEKKPESAKRTENEEDFVIKTESSYDANDRVNADKLITEEHGGLVRKILETKKELDKKIGDESRNASIRVFDERDIAKSQQELANLQRIMQQITQTAHLLSRLFENVQEDAESMFREMEEWRSKNRKNLHQLQEQKGNIQNTTESLLLELNRLDEQIKETKSAIAKTKANIIVNERKIEAVVNDI
ncbi:unnamed protein product [Thelazia callipaeda]|uniref:TRAF3-interacting protein 1 n=1 Tax=Thelazia callipaeda TaxID=103827 RepID=A0A0N5D3L8_THECL|nr:unnamed protein product [Thelazia callipaeda]